MIKIIQTIVLTAVVFSPLSLISLATSATAHHSSSHVSSVAVATTQARKKSAKKGKKPATTGTSQRKTTPDATAQPSEVMPSSGSTPVNPAKPDMSSPDKMKPSGTVSPTPSSSDMPPSGSGMPPSGTGTPPSGSGMPSTPTVPGSGTPTLPTTLPTTK